LTIAPIVYVAFLRGINVGGKNIVSMASVKANFERLAIWRRGTARRRRST
jgi:uncharacterized protein (DUF1697 family)